MQLTLAPIRLITLVALAVSLPRSATAGDEFDVTTTWFQEPRQGPKGLTVIHPSLGLGIDLGTVMNLHLGYSADIVSGATAAVFSIDAVSSATEFTDTRHAGSLAIGFTGRRSSMTFNAAYGAERDYLNLTVGAAATVELPGRNTLLSLSYTHSFDEVCDRDNSMANGALENRPLTIEKCNKDGLFGVDSPTIDLDGTPGDSTLWRDLTIDTIQASLTQNISPTIVAQINGFGTILDGFQANPYRRVRVGQIEAQENHPDVRGRIALLGRVKKFLVKTNSSVGVSLRGYADTWGVEAFTGEMDYNQYVGESLLVRFRARFYQQTQAAFFKDAFFYQTEGTAGAYFTGDRELAPLRNILTGAKLSYIAAGDDGKAMWGVFDEIIFNVKADLMFYKELAAKSNSPNPVGIGSQYLTSTGLIDAIVLQLGLRLKY